MTDQSTHFLSGPRQIPASAHTIGPGWTTLLDQLHRDLLSLAPDYQLDNLTTRFGDLRIHIADRFDEAGECDGAFMDAAETACEHTCELCGAAGRPRFRGDHDRHVDLHRLRDMPHLRVEPTPSLPTSRLTSEHSKVCIAMVSPRGLSSARDSRSLL